MVYLGFDPWKRSEETGKVRQGCSKVSIKVHYQVHCCKQWELNCLRFSEEHVDERLEPLFTFPVLTDGYPQCHYLSCTYGLYTCTRLVSCQDFWENSGAGCTSALGGTLSLGAIHPTRAETRCGLGEVTTVPEVSAYSKKDLWWLANMHMLTCILIYIQISEESVAKLL